MQPRKSPVHIEQGIIRVTGNEWREEADVLAAEEPLEIRLLWWEDGELTQKSIAITMRTPGDDFQLAIGFLFGEGIIASRDDFIEVGYCLDEDETQNLNIVTVTLRPGRTFDLTRLDRNFFTTSSCGVCGKATLEAIEIQGCEILPPGPRVDPVVIRALPERLRDAQAVFDQTGGLHAAGLFDLEGNLLSLREDVGRHNALDKVIGEQVMSGAHRLENCLLLLSGRASFELLQKSLMARIPLVAAVGAPSSLAVDLATTFGITLLGFTRPAGFNIYTHSERVLRPDTVLNMSHANAESSARADGE